MAESSPRHLYLRQTSRPFSHSAADLSATDFEIVATTPRLALPSREEDAVAACSSHLSSAYSSTTTILAAVALPSHSSTADSSPAVCPAASQSSRKPSPIRRAFLTPPLMRKRNRQTRANTEDVLSTSLPNRTPKSPSFFSILKSKFDRNSRVSKNPVTGTCSGPASIAQVTSSPKKNAQHQNDIDDPPASTTNTNLLKGQPSLPSASNNVDGDSHQPPAIISCEENDEQPAEKTQIALAVTSSSTAILPKLSLVKRVSTTKLRSWTTPASSSVDQQPADLESKAGATLTGNTEQPALTAQPSLPSLMPPKTTRSIPTGPFRLHISLKQGRNLVAKDSCGTSDPYVKFKLANKVVYKSKTINRDLDPIWDEDFDIDLQDASVPLNIRVFDYDWGMQDDFMGAAILDLTQLEPNRPSHFTLDLWSEDGTEKQGTIDLSAILYPKPPEDENDPHKNLSAKGSIEQGKKLKVQIWSSVVNIVIIEGKNLADKDGELLSKPHLRLRLANEKYKTKSATRTSTNTIVTWLEQFDFHLFDDQAHYGSHLLEINLFETKTLGREDPVARAVVDLSSMEGEKTHSISCEFEHGGSGILSMLITISGTTACETVTDLTTNQSSNQALEDQAIKKRYAILRTLQNVRDVGHLTVKVFRATGLASADIGGKSDPFCVLQLVNARLQTQTEYKTLNPTWNKIFTFNVKDINSVLEVTVYDEDRDHRFEFLGTVSIPLLRIQNGYRKWYALKDRKLRTRAKGNSPQILLELSVVWNELRASIQTLQPKESKYIEPEMKFDRQTFVRNVMRIKALVMDAIEMGQYIESCWEWESTLRSCVAFFLFLVMAWFVELWMIPAMLAIPFLRSLLIRSFVSSSVNEYDSEGDADDDDDDVDEKNKEERKTLKERLLAIQEATLTVQNSLSYLTSFIESIKNTFNFTVPFLSYLAITLLILGSFVLYAIPLRYLIIAWGINKFTRKILRPHSIPNNELLDFLSRVPNDDQLVEFRELRPEPGSDHPPDKSTRRVTKKK